MNSKEYKHYCNLSISKRVKLCNKLLQENEQNIQIIIFTNDANLKMKSKQFILKSSFKVSFLRKRIQKKVTHNFYSKNHYKLLAFLKYLIRRFAKTLKMKFFFFVGKDCFIQIWKWKMFIESLKIKTVFYIWKLFSLTLSEIPPLLINF